MRNLKKVHIPNIIFRFKSIRSSMMLSFTMVTVVALAIFLIFSLRYTENTVLENSEDYTMQLVEQVNSEIDSYIIYMENISEMVTGNSDVLEYLFNETKGETKTYSRVVDQFKTVMNARSDIYNIAVVADNGRNVINKGNADLNPYVDIKKTAWYQATVEANGAAVLSTSHVQNVIANDYQWVVTLSKGLVNPNTHEVEGVFFIDLNYSAINSLCRKIVLGDKGYLFIVDEHGGIIYHPQQQLLYSELKTEYIDKVMEQHTGNFVTGEGDSRKLYSVCASEKTRWNVVGVSYVKEFMSGKEEMQIAYLLIALGLFLLSTILAILLSREITKPIKALKESMKDVQKGDFAHASMTIEGENEITSLGQSFNIMTEKIQHLMEENIQEQREKRKSELKALQSQINPHFLYNTLDSIIWMAEGGKTDEVVLMTSSLAKLLRQSISNENEIVSIEKEIEYTKGYLTIQKMRYRDQLEFEIEVEPGILKMSIVKLVIQPLVENAIYHGIKYLEGKGTIWIVGSIVENRIILAIRDNGVGMEKETLSHILEKKKDSKRFNRVGVYNVHNRLQLYYGKEYGLTYESVPGIGTTVKISIPCNLQEDCDDIS